MSNPCVSRKKAEGKIHRNPIELIGGSRECETRTRKDKILCSPLQNSYTQVPLRIDGSFGKFRPEVFAMGPLSETEQVMEDRGNHKRQHGSRAWVGCRDGQDSRFTSGMDRKNA